MKKNKTTGLTIGMIDDDHDQLRIHARMFQRKIPKGWNIIYENPFEDIHAYIPWMSEHNICSLIIDEKLSDVSPGATYNGHDLVKHLRKEGCGVPMFILTAIPTDENVKVAEEHVYQVVGKAEIDDAANQKTFLSRVISASQLLHKSIEAGHDELTRIAKKAALGKATKAELDKAEKISLSVYGYSLIGIDNERARWLDRGELLAREIDTLIASIEKANA